METLSERYAAYLCDRTAVATGEALVRALAEAELGMESALLAAYLEGKSALALPNPWSAQPISLGLLPPPGPSLGDTWFDPLELTLCVHVPASADWDKRAGGWFSTHPVQAWQYLGFLKALDFVQPQPSRFPLFDLHEPAFPDLKAPVTGLYAYAAKIYCNWFGKSLVSSNMQFVISQLPPEQYQQIMPIGLNMWDFEFAYGREDQPMAYNLETAASEDGFDLLEMEFPPEKKLVYEEWERSPFVGFGTYVPATGFQFPQAGEVWPFVTLLNMMVR